MTEHSTPEQLENACNICIEAMLPTDQTQLESNLAGLKDALAHYNREALTELIVALACIAAEQHAMLADGNSRALPEADE